MRKSAGDRLPAFTEEEKVMMKGSADFFALNNYFSCLAEHREKKENLDDAGTNSYWNDRDADTSYSEEWKRTDNTWPIVPEGLHDLLVYIQNNYLKDTTLPIFITENGVVVDEPTITQSLNDFKRIDFITLHLKAVEQAIADGANVKRYFYWTLLDDFEWGAGFIARFGLTRVDFGKDPKRTPKGSLEWYANLIKANGNQ